MEANRREFLKLVGLSGLALALPMGIFSFASDGRPKSIKELLERIDKEYKVIRLSSIEGDISSSAYCDGIGDFIPDNIDSEFRSHGFVAGWYGTDKKENIVIPNLYDAITKKAKPGKMFIWRVKPEIISSRYFETGIMRQSMYTRFFVEV